LKIGQYDRDEVKAYNKYKPIFGPPCTWEWIINLQKLECAGLRPILYPDLDGIEVPAPAPAKTSYAYAKDCPFAVYVTPPTIF